MFVKQLSVFVENREGRLDQVLDVLKEEGINIKSLALADTSDFGVLRMIVSDSQKAWEVLKEKGFSAMLTPVLAVKLEHRVGQLQLVLAEVCKAGINIEYMYALATCEEDASIIIKTADLEQAESVLKRAGIELAYEEDLV